MDFNDCQVEPSTYLHIELENVFRFRESQQEISAKYEQSATPQTPQSGSSLQRDTSPSWETVRSGYSNFSYSPEPVSNTMDSSARASNASSPGSLLPTDTSPSLETVRSDYSNFSYSPEPVFNTMDSSAKASNASSPGSSANGQQHAFDTWDPDDEKSGTSKAWELHTERLESRFTDLAEYALVIGIYDSPFFPKDLEVLYNQEQGYALVVREYEDKKRVSSILNLEASLRHADNGRQGNVERLMGGLKLGDEEAFEEFDRQRREDRDVKIMAMRMARGGSKIKLEYVDGVGKPIWKYGKAEDKGVRALRKPGFGAWLKGCEASTASDQDSAKMSHEKPKPKPFSSPFNDPEGCEASTASDQGSAKMSHEKPKLKPFFSPFNDPNLAARLKDKKTRTAVLSLETSIWHESHPLLPEGKRPDVNEFSGRAYWPCALELKTEGENRLTSCGHRRFPLPRLDMYSATMAQYILKQGIYNVEELIARCGDSMQSGNGWYEREVVKFNGIDNLLGTEHENRSTASEGVFGAINGWTPGEGCTIRGAPYMGRDYYTQFWGLHGLGDVVTKALEEYDEGEVPEEFVKHLDEKHNSFMQPVFKKERMDYSYAESYGPDGMGGGVVPPYGGWKFERGFLEERGEWSALFDEIGRLGEIGGPNGY